MRQWPQNKVDRSISQYLSSATTSRGSLKLIADKEDPAGDFAYLIEQTRGNINGSPRARTAIPARMFTKESVNPTISREEVGCVLRGWCQSISGGRSTFPILGYYYKRIQQFVEHQVKSSGPFTPPIQEVCGVLSYYRSPLASEYASSMGCATVEDKALRLSGLGSILLQSVHKPFPLDSRFDRMAPLDEITLWAMRSSESSVLAMALSQLASLCVTDFIRAAFVRSGTLGKAPKVYSLLGRPVILVEQAPTFKIVVGYRLRKHIPFD